MMDWRTEYGLENNLHYRAKVVYRTQPSRCKVCRLESKCTYSKVGGGACGLQDSLDVCGSKLVCCVGCCFLNKPYTSSGGRFTVTEQIKITVVGYLAAGADGCL